MRVLVTGASGLIGGALSDALLARGDEVVGLSRDPEKARQTNPTVRWFAWQATLERPPAEAFEGVEGVVNLIGEPINQRWNEESKRRIMESRRASTHNLVQAIGALQDRPKVLVSQSAIGYYGDRGEAIVDESAPPGSGFAAEVPVEWERAAHEADDLLRVVVVRSGLVLDPGDGLLKQLLTPFKLGVGGPIGSGDQYMSWIHIDDEIVLLLWALDDEQVTGTLNATAPNPVTNRELSKALGRVLRRPAVLPVPGVALNVMLGRELAETVKDGQRVLPRRALDLGFTFKHPDLEPALRDLL
ncbi:MAG: TIGR01777 family oxidoreductase [Actinomycetota bacterium]|nr:TIGR01777 family oxidoreductase [Actinomycetota bacterium]